MEISILLGEKILSMLVACFVGFVVVKVKMLKVEDSKGMSMLVAFICSPCSLICAFSVEATEERITGLGIAILVAIAWNIALVAVSRLMGKVWKLNGIEEASIVYSNAGYLVIPIVYTVLGAEWVLYTTAFLICQTAMYWSHGMMLLCGETKIHWKKMLLNPNLIAIYIGIVLFFTGFSFPTFIADSISDFGNMIGAVSMFVIGMLIGKQDLKEMFKIKRLYFISLIRLIAIPFVAVVTFALVGAVVSHPQVQNILMVVLWAACAPTGAMVTQLAQIYDLDAEYAGKINLISVLFCIFTMPLNTYLYDVLSTFFSTIL